MRYIRHLLVLIRSLGLALPLAGLLLCLFTLPAQAHAILLKSDPAKDAVLTTAPTQVSMWFTEDLNPAFSTAEVVNARNARINTSDAHVTANDAREIQVALPANVSPGVYVVVWRTQSADDGHVLRGSFRFSVAQADGTVPQANGNTVPGTGVLGSSNDASSGQLDSSSLFSFLMITLVDLGVVFWVGAQLWHSFVLQLFDTGELEQRVADQRAVQRFESFFAAPVLLLLLLANFGVLIGQGLSLSGGSWSQALSPETLQGLILHSRFGTYWLWRIAVLVLALLLAIFVSLQRERSRIINNALAWINLILALALLIAMTLSGHAAAVSGDIQTFAILGDWLHLLAAALWIGGMLYLALIYLPILRHTPWAGRARILLSTLAHYSPLAIAGVIIMAVTGPFNAVVHMESFEQLLTTAYGRALTVKTLLVVLLLVASAIHLLLYRPRLKKVTGEYEDLVADPMDEQEGRRETLSSATGPEVKALEGKLEAQTRRMTKILRWEPLLGVAVLVCTGLLNVFAGTLLPTTSGQAAPSQSTVVKPFHGTVQTKDHQYTLKVTVSPNRFGTNVFTVNVLDAKGKPDTQVGVSIYTTMLDMDMGTDAINLQPDTKGDFSGQGDLNMGGHWQLRIEVRTPQNTLHSGTIDLTTPF
ncbi:copper resistance protein [Dictyobacter alpinus]|uniref:Copper resistance protein n=1 Tax=Dictyobacter alpinus TaxID=2014873 RepID=A0A402B2Z6_9CHLR|nr:copper resistance protein CopC [Dictyobacter alpinus]GCE25708.1 copper resistance protein [Dictyobacter alpinus]